MWRLKMTNSAKEWIDAGNFETLSDTARRILEIEDRPGAGVFFSVFVETDFGTDAEFLGHLEYTGKRALYVVKRQVN